MICWTPAGAVAAPEALQIRLAPRFDGRVSVGAPMPPRALAPEEVDANVRHFTEGMRGPRTRPVGELVLSGLDDHQDLAGLAAAVPAWRELGIASLVLHISVDAAAPVLDALGALADRVVVTVSRVDSDVWRALGELPIEGLSVSIALSGEVLPHVPALVDQFRARPPKQLAWVWPFPVPGTPPPPVATRVVAALASAGAFEGLPSHLVHVPACQDPTFHHDDRRVRTRNRYYVDATHQLADAMLFFPDLVRLAKPDRCRFCRAHLSCSGVAAAWLEQGISGALEPM